MKSEKKMYSRSRYLALAGGTVWGPSDSLGRTVYLTVIQWFLHWVSPYTYICRGPHHKRTSGLLAALSLSQSTHRDTYVPVSKLPILVSLRLFTS